MAYSYINKRGQTYYLHQRKAGKNRDGMVYFFAKEKKEGVMDKIPEGYNIMEVERTGMPMLKKS